MAKTYGGKRSDTGEAMYDAYPLKRLAILLCFEDMDEARAACKHYNITVKEAQTSSSSSPSGRSAIEIIHWRMSPFKEAKDPIKKVVLPLTPRKMIRTIESKLNGATRLSVCRGEVSGDGASLSIVHDRSSKIANRMDEKPAALSAEEIEARRRGEEAARRSQEEQQRQMKELAAKQKMEEEWHLREGQKKKEEEKLRQEEADRKKEEEAKRRALLLQKQKEAEVKKKLAEDERKRKLELEEAKRATEAAAREEQLRQVAEEQRRAAEREEARRRAKAEEHERLRQEEVERKREEEERVERVCREEEEKKRQEQERRRLHQLKLEQEREEQERRRREEEVRRIAEAREAKINSARKLLIWRRLRHTLDRELQKERTRQSLCRIDPTLSSERPVLVNLSGDIPGVAEDASLSYNLELFSDLLPGIHVLDLLSRESNPPLHLSTMLRRAFYSLRRKKASLRGPGDVVLAKLAVVLPTFAGPKADSMQALLQMWFGRRLQYRNVMLDQPGFRGSSYELRTVTSSIIREAADCDMALFVVPPFFGDDSLDWHSRVRFPPCNVNIPRAVLCLDNGANRSYADFVDNLLFSLQDVPTFYVGEEMGISVFDLALEECCDALLESFVEADSEGRTRGGLVRLSILQLGSSCIRGALWRTGIPPGANEESKIISRARATVMALATELDSLNREFRSKPWWNWPALEFADKDGVVKNYFGEGVHLPLDWKQNLSRSEVEPAVMKLYDSLDGSLRDVVGRMTAEAPEHVREDVKSMLAKRQFRRCLEYTLMWREAEHEPFGFVYLPKGCVRDVIEGCIRRMALDDDDELDLGNVSGHVELEEEMSTKDNNLRTLVGEPLLCAEVDWVRGDQLESLPFNDSQPLAGSFRTPESTVMTPAGVTTPMTPAGVNTPITMPESKRPLDLAARDKVLHSAKRRRDDHLSKNQRESMAFTEKLEALLQGEATFDVAVGGSTLSALLRDAPDIQLPSSFCTD